METIQNDSPLQHLHFILNTPNYNLTDKATNRFFHLLKNYIAGTIIHLFWNDCASDIPIGQMVFYALEHMPEERK